MGASTVCAPLKDPYIGRSGGEDTRLARGLRGMLGGMSGGQSRPMPACQTDVPRETRDPSALHAAADRVWPITICAGTLSMASMFHVEHE